MRHPALIGLYVVVFSFGLSSQPVSAQAKTSSVPTRDPGAVAALQNSLAAMGGLRAIAAVQNSVTLGTRQAAEGNTLPSGDFTWETSGDQFRYDESR